MKASLGISTNTISGSTVGIDVNFEGLYSVSAMAQICQFDLEQSFLALQMAKGSNGDFTVASFMDFYWNEMAKQIGQDIELIRWQGDTTSENATLALCDGYIKNLLADSTVVDVANTTVNSGNVLAQLALIFAGFGNVFIHNDLSISIYCSASSRV